MKALSIKSILEATGGKFIGDPWILDAEITSITTDSRKAENGSLFGAIPGERVDGHDFLRDVAERGALCAIVEREIENPPLPVIVTDGTQGALGKIAAFYRSQFDIPFIGITGSVGKTTTKEMLSHVLRESRNTLWTAGNFNNELGVPLTLFRLEEEHEAAIIEMGISEFGEMTRLSEIVRPDYAFITSIADAHLEALGDRKGVLKAKTEIIGAMPRDGVLILNGDDPLLWDFHKNNPGIRTLTYGLNARNHIHAENVKFLGKEGTSFTLVSHRGMLPLLVPAYGKHIVYAALAACALALEMGISSKHITSGISSYHVEGSRGAIIDTGSFSIIDDCYNANPGSVEMAIASMDTLTGRRVCILGDMLQLGSDSHELHRDVGRAAVQSGVELIIACGNEAAYICLGARDAGGDAMYFDTKDDLLTALPGLVRPGDNILVKASRGMAFESLVEELKRV